MNQLQVMHAQLAKMQEHVQACLPEEACGLLAGSEGVVVEVLPVQNQVHSPFRFRMDPVEQLHAFQRIEARGWDLLGIFHSHPAGPAHPSATDIAEAAYDVVHVIWSPRGATWQAKGFLIRDAAALEVKLYVADAAPGFPAAP